MTGGTAVEEIGSCARFSGTARCVHLPSAQEADPRGKRPPGFGAGETTFSTWGTETPGLATTTNAQVPQPTTRPAGLPGLRYSTNFPAAPCRDWVIKMAQDSVAKIGSIIIPQFAAFIANARLQFDYSLLGKRSPTLGAPRPSTWQRWSHQPDAGDSTDLRARNTVHHERRLSSPPPEKGHCEVGARCAPQPICQRQYATQAGP